MVSTYLVQYTEDGKCSAGKLQNINQTTIPLLFPLCNIGPYDL